MDRVDTLMLITMVGVLLTDLIERQPDEETFVNMNHALKRMFFSLTAAPEDSTTPDTEGE